MPKGVYIRTKNHKGKSAAHWKGGLIEIICRQCGKHTLNDK